MTDPIQAFKHEISLSGIQPPENIEINRLTRFSDNGGHNKNGWCSLFVNPDGTAGGAFGNWKDINEKWFYTPKGTQISSSQQRQLNQKILEAQRKAKNEIRRKQADAAIKATELWDSAQEADPAHEYLVKKNVEPYGIRQLGKTLLVPVLDQEGKIISLQQILSDGKKKFMPGGKTRGGSFIIGNIEQAGMFYICEGYATGATIHKASENPVVVAFNSGNLKMVAGIFKGKHPSKTIVIAADNDITTEKKTGTNPGIKAAKEAAEKINVKLCSCPVDSDFNDLQKSRGLDVVKEALTHQGNIPWDDPIVFTTPPLPSMPLGTIPECIRGIVSAVSEATETPVELSCGLVVSVLGAACQGKFQIEVEPGYYEPLNIWVVTALDPANRKSAVLSMVSKPLTDWEQIKKQGLEREIKDASIKRKNQEARLKSLRMQYGKAKAKELNAIEGEIIDIEKNLIEVPTLPKIWAQDVTPEHLGTLMNNHNERMSILSAEGGLFDILAGRYSGGVPNLDLFLQSHSGDSVRVDRGSREPVYLNNPSLTLGLSPQPIVLKSIANKPGFRGKGLLARFLYLLPKSNLGYRTLKSTPVPEETKDCYSRTIHSLLDIAPPEDEYGNAQPYLLKFSKEAHHEWKEFQIAVETNLREGEVFESITDWAGKLPGAAARLAALFHCAENPNQPWNTPVSIDTTRKALNLATIISQHTLAVFELMGADIAIEHALKILRWIKRNRHKEFSKRDCFGSLQSTFQKVSNMECPLTILIERNILREIKHETGGRPSIHYTTNPKITEEWI